MTTRLSQSGLWEHQRAYYHKQGVQAWNTGTVPHYVTNNPIIGDAYADLIIAHLDDLEREGALDPAQPVCIVEMGGGSGRLAYYILRRLDKFREQLPVQLRYVLTDFTTTNLEHWREHPKFTPYFEQELLDLAVFDAETTDELVLEKSGLKLDGSGNPVFFIANYVFDSIPLDCFRIHQGTLQEAHAAVTYGEEAISIEYNYQDAEESPYGRKDYDSILRQYRERLGDTHFLFPVGPLRCLENLTKIAGSSLCLLTADKGWTRWEEFVGLGPPPLVEHGSFSLNVNFHSMGLYWEDLGGQFLCNSQREAMLDICCFSMGLPDAALKRTKRMFADKVESFGPLDFLNLRNAITEATPRDKRSLRLCLELLRLSHWDAEVLYEFADPLATGSENVSAKEKREIFVTLSKVWANYFPIGETKDVPFEIARILFRLEYYEPSLTFYEESLRLFGTHKMTFHNMGLCYYYLRRLEQAKASFEKSLELDPGYGVARDWLLRLAPEIEESGTFSAVAIG